MEFSPSTSSSSSSKGSDRLLNGPTFSVLLTEFKFELNWREALIDVSNNLGLLNRLKVGASDLKEGGGLSGLVSICFALWKIFINSSTITKGPRYEDGWGNWESNKPTTGGGGKIPPATECEPGTKTAIKKF